MVTVVLLVALRLSIGCHFLYEGVWKIEHADEFSARPFLTQAKGPLAPLFYAMVPDLDGRQRLKIGGDGTISAQLHLEAWAEIKQSFLDKYQPSDEQIAEVEKLHKVYLDSLKEYLAENQEDIAAYFHSLDRFEKLKASGNNGTAHQKKRIWDKQQALRAEVNGWLLELDGMGEEYQSALWNLLDDDQRTKGLPSPAVLETDALPIPLPFVNSQSEFVDFAVTYGLTAIGLCMMLGLCNRLACIGGGLFLISVLLTQPPWPTIYPPVPPVAGHALLVDKNFVEMVAMFVLATTPVGRWGGLDRFLHQWLGQPLFAYLEKKRFARKHEG